MQNNLSNYAILETEEIKQQKITIYKQKRIKKLLKEKLEKVLNFKIADYIIMDIIENETYDHFCYMVNLSVVNNRISKGEGEMLKQEIKEFSNIKNNMDRLDKGAYLKEFNYEEWDKKYHTEEFIDLNKYFNKKDKQILDKLGIKVQDKIYTNYEFDVLEEKYLLYYRDEKEMDDEDLKLSKSLEGTGVSREEYNKLLEKINKILTDYNL